MANCFGKCNGIARLPLSTCRFISFSACEDFFNYNSWEKLLIARRNIELESCITEF